jgi:hypothetical protein
MTNLEMDLIVLGVLGVILFIYYGILVKGALRKLDNDS